MAYLEATLALATIVDQYDFEGINLKQVHYGSALTLPMLDGLKVKVHNINE